MQQLWPFYKRRGYSDALNEVPMLAKFNFVVSASHVPGKQNQLADALSRNSDQFLLDYPQASPQPSQIPPALVDLLITSKPDWLSQHLSHCLHYHFQNINCANLQLSWPQLIFHTVSALRHFQVANNLPDPSISNMPKLEG